ncbi:uncharacterized protein LOC117316355 [Pecten maximus]|uniref:uncharacterized protein LOC117316355 n=1 Tax=Pecten maximus TaxID=6579 RepID=UPI0014582CDB|nr:uncharacterized protein LOC117316355 [Pecten maximus]
MGTIIYTFCKERFGVEGKQRNSMNRIIPNRRQDTIQRLGRELKGVTRQYRKASREDRIASAARRYQGEPGKTQESRAGGERAVRLNNSIADIEQHLKEVHSDGDRDFPRIGAEEPSEFQLDIMKPTWKEIQDIVKKARTGSAHGPSGIPYKLYKKCPRLLRRLAVTQESMEEGKDTIMLAKGRGMLCSKGEGRIRHRAVQNNFIVERRREAKSNRGNLTVVWLDLANAYGSIPHQLIEEGLQHYFIPEHIRGIVRSYFNGIQEVVSRARMKFKARKSRCMIMRKGRLKQQFKLKVQGEEIPSIEDNSIKCLGKWFDASLKDTSNISSMQKQAIEWMRKIDKSGLPGKFKR